jgi:hypothetical protein
MRLAVQEGQTPRFLQEKGSSRSKPQAEQRILANPRARQVAAADKRAQLLFHVVGVTLAALAACLAVGQKGQQVLTDQLVQDRLLRLARPIGRRQRELCRTGETLVAKRL